jgi:kinetochore protein Mis12/MTW1
MAPMEGVQRQHQRQHQHHHTRSPKLPGRARPPVHPVSHLDLPSPLHQARHSSLSHYEGLDFSSLRSDGDGGGDADTYTGEGGRPSIESVTRLRRKLRESLRLNALLHAEHDRNSKLLGDLRSLVGVGVSADVKVEGAGDEDEDATSSTATRPEIAQPGPLAFLREKASPLRDAGADTPLSTTTAFTLSQLQALRALSSSLRTMAPDLKPSGTDEEDDEEGHGDDGPAKRSWRRERLEYVESATRRHLEAVQGLELGRDGEVRDGEWQGEGRRLAGGEVEGLESVVALLSGENAGASSPNDVDEDRMDES